MTTATHRSHSWPSTHSHWLTPSGALCHPPPADSPSLPELSPIILPFTSLQPPISALHSPHPRCHCSLVKTPPPSPLFPFFRIHPSAQPPFFFPALPAARQPPFLLSPNLSIHHAGYAPRGGCRSHPPPRHGGHPFLYCGCPPPRHGRPPPGILPRPNRLQPPLPGRRGAGQHRSARPTGGGGQRPPRRLFGQPRAGMRAPVHRPGRWRHPQRLGGDGEQWAGGRRRPSRR